MPQRIVIIEDDAPITMLIARALEAAAYQPLVSVTHDTIALLAEDVRPDLFIVNLLRGWEYIGLRTLFALRARAATATLPVILCSSDTTFLHTQREALAQRNCLTLAKPFLIHDLLDVVRGALALAPPPRAFCVPLNGSPRGQRVQAVEDGSPVWE